MTDDADLASDERRALTCVLDELIPCSADGRFPAAGELDIVAYLCRRMRQKPSLRATVRAGLAALELAARARGATGFAALGRDDREAVLREHAGIAPAFVAELLVETYSAYYQHPRVVEALGLEARPPYPGGHRVEPTDFASLLESVSRRAKMYRRT